jgi:hypothetical protein
MSTYNLRFANLELATGSAPCAAIEISGNQFPQPSNDQLSLGEGTITGSFAADEGAPTVDSFTFYLTDSADLSTVTLQFEGYPEDYSGVPLTATLDFSMGGDEFALECVTATKQDNKKGVKVGLSRSIGGMTENGDTIISFSETTTTYNGEPRATGDLTIKQSETDNLEATCSSGIDFNALDQPWLICWNSDEDPENKIFIGSVSIQDNNG